uniref:Uncharacterized protein n=1 Tax=Timema bartmani TaxID=61472 RepID=A0A7R9I1Y7_9NEOP|nr:unnamed protein product [Timema bartmani]
MSGSAREAIDSSELMPPLIDEIKDGQWLGVTVRSQGPGGKVLGEVACAGSGNEVFTITGPENKMRQNPERRCQSKIKHKGGYVCAHRYVRRGADFQWGQGLCYTLTQYLDYDESWEPCKGRPTNK